MNRATYKATNRARSIHIGLNHVNPDAYGGWDGELNACINDANDLRSVAGNLGYDPAVLLTDEEATSNRALQEISLAARELSAGDILLVTYSGHGGQVEDANSDESDQMDETWVLWDRQVVDDELFAMWAQFAPGVRVVVLSDSCHSGTVLKIFQAPAATRGGPRIPREIKKAAELKVTRALQLEQLLTREDESSSTEPPLSRNMPWAEAVKDGDARGDIYDNAQYVAGSKEHTDVQASVLLISGCQDNQLSFDGVDNGRFTGTLLRTWNDGQFQGSYRDFHDSIVSQMPPNQTPNFFVVGTRDQAFESQRPFTIQAPGSPSAGEHGTATRPTLRRGAKGQAVRELQQLLSNRGMAVTVDGIFGWGTEGAVKEFQSRNGLSADGIVGPSTWQKLESSGSGGGDTGGSGDTGVSDAGTTASSGARPTLRQGGQGQQQHVRYLQQRLQAHGFNLTIDGIFGPRVASMVRAFQSAQGLTVDGVVGPDTWRALERAPRQASDKSRVSEV